MKGPVRRVLGGDLMPGMTITKIGVGRFDTKRVWTLVSVPNPDRPDARYRWVIAWDWVDGRIDNEVLTHTNWSYEVINET